MSQPQFLLVVSGWGQKHIRMPYDVDAAVTTREPHNEVSTPGLRFPGNGGLVRVRIFPTVDMDYLRKNVRARISFRASENSVPEIS